MLTVSTRSGTATATIDYASLSEPLSFASSAFTRVDIGGGVMRYRSALSHEIAIVDDAIDEEGEQFTVELARSLSASALTVDASSTPRTVTITDNDASSNADLSGLTISPGTLMPGFTSGTTVYTASVGYGVTSVTVTPTVSDTGKARYTVNGGAQDTATEVDLDVSANTITITVTAEDESTQDYTITVTRAKATVSISRGAAEATEGDALSFTVTRDASPDEALTVTVNVTESGSLVATTNKGQKTVTILANAASAELTVQTDADDAVWEEHSTVTVTVAANAAHDRGSPYAAETLVKDNDFPQATAVLAVSPNPVSEGGGPVIATVTATTARDEMPHGEGSGEVLTVSTRSGTATATIDYASLSEPLSFASSAFTRVDIGGGVMRYRSALSHEIAIVDDAIDEEGEQFTVELARSLSASALTVDASSTPRTVTITDNDASSNADLSGLTISPGTLMPGFTSGTTVYTASVGYGVTSVTVTPTVSDTGKARYTVNGGAQDTATEVDLDVGANTITITVTAEDESTQDYTITATRAKATVSISRGAAEATEGDALSFTVTRSASPDEALTVTVNVTESGSLVATTNKGQKTVTILANAASAELTVQTDADDAVWEEHSTVTVTVAANAAHDRGSPYAAETLVKDDDFPQATAVLAVSPNPVSEGGTVTATVTFTTNADQQPHAGRTVTLATSDGTAVSPGDYGSLSASHAFSAGDFQRADVGGGTMRYRAVKTSTVTTVNDTDTEDAEAFTVAMTADATTFPPATLGADSVSVTINASDAPVLSGDATLSGLTVSPGTLAPTFASGTADYTASVGYGVTQMTVTPTKNVASSSVSFLDGADSALTDADSASGHQVNLAVGANTIKVKVTAEDSTENTYTITVTRAKATVSISRGAAEATEGDALSFTVTRDASPDEALTVTVNVTESGSLVATTNKGQKTVTILANAASAELTVQTDADDAVWEEHSTVTVTVAANAAHDRGSPYAAETLVKDNDFPQATAVLAVSPNPVSEGGTIDITITVTTNADQEPHGPGGTLTLTAVPETALATDFRTLSPADFTLAHADFAQATVGGNYRWQKTYQGTLEIIDDTDTENAETLSINLDSSRAPKVTPNPSTAKITITANDASTDATLAALSLEDARNNTIILTPQFTPDRESYTANAFNHQDRVRVTATPNDSNAATPIIRLNGATVSGREMSIDVGNNNVITIQVNAQDGIATKTYGITVNRAPPPPTYSEDATLHWLKVDHASLSPAFASNYLNYNTTVYNEITETNVYYQTSDPRATTVADFNGAPSNGRNLPLAAKPEENLFTIEVTSPDGDHTVIYTVNITRDKSDDTRLGELQVVEGETVLTLDPSLHSRWLKDRREPMVYQYAVITGATDTPAMLKVTTAPWHPKAKVKQVRIDGIRQSVGQGNPGAAITFSLQFQTGLSRLEITVVAENGNEHTHEVMVHVPDPNADAPAPQVHAVLLPSTNAEAGAGGVTLYAWWTDDRQCAGYQEQRGEDTLSVNPKGLYFTSLYYRSQRQTGFLTDPVLSEAAGGFNGASGWREWANADSVNDMFGDRHLDSTNIEVWCGPRPYWYRDDNGEAQRANEESRLLGTATIEFPDAPPAPPEPTVAPGTPTGLAGRLHGNEATLTWDTVAGASGYELSIKVGEDWMLIDPAEFKEKYRLTVVVGEGTATMSPLYDSSYEFRVRAVNDIGASDWSEAATLEY